MLKRLKWNVLYNEDADDDGGGVHARVNGDDDTPYNEDSDSGDEDDDSVDGDADEAKHVLQQLADNDPYLRAVPVDEEEKEEEEKEEKRTDLMDKDYIKGKECMVCSGKRLLSEADRRAHVTSKQHRKSVRRHEQRMQREDEDDEDEDSDSDKDTGRAKSTRPVGVECNASSKAQDAKESSEVKVSERGKKRKLREKKKLQALKKKKKKKERLNKDNKTKAI